ncbi:rod shape-determining protein MreD [Tateyamaria omphalii]|uniref:Rod shape-determining protein MreD n=1 Tax=Tateyamaria omphalii TaxID=299262 RepID=A0A1P8N042_9RHOB|nr:rod shape-determining protein MreD [Tateyamaria omphalii]APX13529.1 rod shape-determining protein MreD [Tateyamaria omphalii]
MSDIAPSTRLWTMRIAFSMLVLMILFLHLLPLQTATGGLIWPDFLLLFALAWSVRRPDYVPAALLAALFLMADLLLQRPPGLWALLALIACEQMKGQSRSLRDASLAAEMMSAALWIVGIGLAYRIILAVMVVDVPPLGPAVIQILVTAMTYPLVVAITHALMRVRKPTPGDIDGKGVRS